MNAIDKRALVIGGSLAGLFAGTLLRSIGWQVDIYERSPHTLDSRGGGIVLQADVVEAFQRAGIAYEDPFRCGRARTILPKPRRQHCSSHAVAPNLNLLELTVWFNAAAFSG